MTHRDHGMTGRTRRNLSRLEFADGAALLARDLDDLTGYEAQLLGLHVRGVHDTSGVAEGLRFSIDASGRQVTVSPGAAYNPCGDVIAIHRSVTIPGPRRPVLGGAARFVLMLGAPTSELSWPCERPARCTGERGVIRVPTLHWVPAVTKGSTPAGAPAHSGAVRSDMDIPLGSVVRRTDGTLTDLSYDDRRSVRPLSRPHIGNGAVAAGGLTWSAAAFPLRAWIDTRTAGFSTTPVYFASLSPIPELPTTLIGPFVSIEFPSATGFSLRLLFADRPAQSATAISELVTSRLSNVQVRWTGVESAHGCSPTVSLGGFV